MPVVHCSGAALGEIDHGCQGVGVDGEIRAREGRAQIGVRGTGAPSGAHRHVEATKAFLLEAVQIRRERVTRLPRCREPCGIQGVRKRAVGGLQRPGIAAIDVTAFGARLGAAKVGQYLTIGPARGPFFFPAFKVQRIAAHIDHAVD